MNTTMNVNSAYGNYHSASAGIQRGMQGLARNAAQLAGSQQLEGTKDATQSLVDNRVAKTNVQANVKALAAADETLGTLLDVTA
jgi:hypothetical protein